MPEMIYGRWNPTEVRTRIVNDTWTTVESVTGLEKITPSSIDFSGTRASLDSTGRVEFTKVSSITINDAFSSAYKNYRIYFSINNFLWANTDLRCRLVQSNGTEVATNYLYSQSRPFGNAFDPGKSNSGQTGWIIATATLENCSHEMDLSSPFLTNDKSFYKKGIRDDDQRDDTTFSLEDFFGYVTSTTSCTGIKLYPDNASDYISGSIYIYGFR